VGSGGEGRETGGRAWESGIFFGSRQGVPISSVDAKIVWLTKDLFQSFLVFGFASESVGFGDRTREVSRVNQGLFVVNNVNFPQRSIPLIGIFFAMAID